MGKTIKGLLAVVGLGGGSKAPKVSGEASQEIKTQEKKSKRRRASQFETEGGVVGQELDPTQISGSNNILGN